MKHTSGLITRILLLYNSVIDHSNVFIVRFTMLNTGYFFKNTEYKGSAVIGWGIFFFLSAAGVFFLLATLVTDQ